MDHDDKPKPSLRDPSPRRPDDRRDSTPRVDEASFSLTPLRADRPPTPLRRDPAPPSWLKRDRPATPPRPPLDPATTSPPRDADNTPPPREERPTLAQKRPFDGPGSETNPGRSADLPEPPRPPIDDLLKRISAAVDATSERPAIREPAPEPPKPVAPTETTHSDTPTSTPAAPEKADMPPAQAAKPAAAAAPAAPKATPRLERTFGAPGPGLAANDQAKVPKKPAEAEPPVAPGAPATKAVERKPTAAEENAGADKPAPIETTAAAAPAPTAEKPLPNKPEIPAAPSDESISRQPLERPQPAPVVKPVQQGPAQNAKAPVQTPVQTPVQPTPRLVAENAGLEVRSLGKQFKKRPVLRDVSLRVQRGEAVGLLGPNGAGKTTCFYIVTGLIAPDYGDIVLDGEDITDLPMYRRARLGIGYLPQEASIFRGLTVEQNILAVLELIEKDRDRRETILEALMAEFAIGHLRRTPAVALSGGERRRLEIARALASQPHFILLDEPLAGIDPIAVRDIRELVSHLKDRGIGVLITDHNVRETLDIVDRAYILHDGSVLMEGTPQAIVEDQEVRRVYLGDRFQL